MDLGLVDDLLTNEQLGSDEDQELLTVIEDRLKELHTCLPGIVQSYNPNNDIGPTVNVQPAIQRTFVDGVQNFPLLEDVPVYFPGGAGWSVTFPVEPGDECLLIFSERCMNYWLITGELRPGENYRLHDPSDAFALVGIRSKPRKLSNVQTDGIELRADDRSTYLKLKSTGIEIKGDVTVTGTITAADFEEPSGLKFSNHIHPSGTPNTSGPISPP
jgi:hypothetical protein